MPRVTLSKFVLHEDGELKGEIADRVDLGEIEIPFLPISGTEFYLEEEDEFFYVDSVSFNFSSSTKETVVLVDIHPRDKNHGTQCGPLCHFDRKELYPNQ